MVVDLLCDVSLLCLCGFVNLVCYCFLWVMILVGCGGVSCWVLIGCMLCGAA